MKQKWRQIAGLLCVLLIVTLLPAVGFAEGAETDKAADAETELSIAEDPDDGFISVAGEDEDPGSAYWEELRPFWGARYAWLQLELDQPLLELVGHQRRGVTCACYSLAYCRTLLDGEKHLFSEYNLGSGEEDAWCSWLDGDYDSFATYSASDAYERIYQELCEGKPSVILVKGVNTQQHYIAVVGFENVVNGQPLDAYNFLILDPGAADFEPRNMGEQGFDLKRTEYGTLQVCYCTDGASVDFEAHGSSYLSRCQFLYAERLLRSRPGAFIASLPCEKKRDASSEVLRSLEKSQFFKADALVKNTAGEYWYRGTDESGTRGYVRAELLGIGVTQCSDFALDGLELPGVLPEGEGFILRGKIGVGHPYDRITVALRQSGEDAAEPLSLVEIEGPGRFCDLEVAVGDALALESLAPGDYRIEISADFTARYCTDGKTLRTAVRTAQLLSEDFTIACDEPIILF